MTRHTLVLAPFPITRCLVVDARKESEVFQRHLLFFDSQLMVEFSLSRMFDALDTFCQVGAGLARDHERVRAACVCPHVGKGDLLGGTLLQKEFVLVIEEEDGEGSVEEALVDVGHQMACEATGSVSHTKNVDFSTSQSAQGQRKHVQIFLLAVPIASSFSSRTMQTSSMSRICSSSWPSSSEVLVVSMSGKRRKIVSAVIAVV